MYYNTLNINKINNSQGGGKPTQSFVVHHIQGRAKRLGLGFFCPLNPKKHQ